MTRKLFVMRHGETLFNQLGLIQGWSDSPLTDEGIKQAQAARQFFDDKHIVFDKLYSSTAERCCDTLELATGRTDYIRLKGLKEFNFGRFEAQPEFLHPSMEEKGHPEDYYLQHGGDSQKAFEERVWATFQEIIAADGDCILAVCHAGTTMAFLSLVLEADVLPKHSANCGIYEYIIDNGNCHFVALHDPVNRLTYHAEQLYD